MNHLPRGGKTNNSSDEAPRGKVMVRGFEVCGVLNGLHLCYTSLNIIAVLGKRNQFVVLCVLCGLSNAAYIRDDGVFVVPITALKD